MEKRYKIVVKMNDKTFVKERSKNKDYLMEKALIISNKHPKWKLYVVQEDSII